MCNIQVYRGFSVCGYIHCFQSPLFNVCILCRDGRPVTDDEIVGMLIGFLLAGQHTSSTTSAWLGFFFAQNQEIQVQRGGGISVAPGLLLHIALCGGGGGGGGGDLSGSIPMYACLFDPNLKKFSGLLLCGSGGGGGDKTGYAY